MRARSRASHWLALCRWRKRGGGGWGGDKWFLGGGRGGENTAQDSETEGGRRGDCDAVSNLNRGGWGWRGKIMQRAAYQAKTSIHARA